MSVGQVFPQPLPEMGLPPVIDAIPHNAAADSLITGFVAKMWDKLAEPVAPAFARLEETNHTLGVVAANALLTAPRLLDVPLSSAFTEAVAEGRLFKASTILVAKAVAKTTDGLDGPVTRASNTTSAFGAGFDPFVDMAGALSDIASINKLAKAEDDQTVVRAMKTSLLSNALAFVTGGVLSGVAETYARKHGVIVEGQDTAKANAEGKMRYTAACVGNTALQLSYLTRNPRAKSGLRTTGLVLNGVSSGIGVLSAVKYTVKAAKKVAAARAA